MLRIHAESANTDKVEALFKLFNTYTNDVLDLAEESFKDIRPRLLVEFRAQPPARRWPQDYPGNLLPFDTEKQRRWYWATIGRPWTRTGQMTQNLNQTIERERKRVSVTARYGSAATKFVIGNIQGEEVKRYQQRFHKVTGWEEAGPKLMRHAQTYSDTFTRRYESFIAFYRD